MLFRAYAVLLRAIGPATHAIMPMQSLCARCLEAGVGQITNYLATGNLLAITTLAAADLKEIVEAAVRSFGLSNGVFVRDRVALDTIIAGNPFPEATCARPSQVIVCFGPDSGLDGRWVDSYPGPERLVLSGHDLYVDYPAETISKSKLVPGMIERRSRAQLTFRNWNTVTGIANRLVQAG